MSFWCRQMHPLHTSLICFCPQSACVAFVVATPSHTPPHITITQHRRAHSIRQLLSLHFLLPTRTCIHTCTSDSLVMKLTPLQCANHACAMLNMPEKHSEKCTDSEHHCFHSILGASFKTISELWNMLNPINNISNRAQPKHLLWTMVFLKVYKSEPVHLQLTGCKSHDTFQQWVLRFGLAIADLESKVIVFENCFKNWCGRTQCLICIDGTDVHIAEPAS